MTQPNRPQNSSPACERLLANEEVLLIHPILAQAIGLEASVVLKQLAYWLEQNEKKDRQKLFQDGHWWSFNSYEEWRDENFPFLSVSSIRRHFSQLEALGLVISTQKYNPSPMLNSKWYSIDIPAYNAFMALWEALGRPWANASKAESKAAYARFLKEWQAAKTDLKGLETRFSLASQNTASIPQNPADGVQAGTEDFAQTEEGAEAFIPPYWEYPAVSSPHDVEMLAGIIPSQALSGGFIPRPPEILDATAARPLDILLRNRSDHEEPPAHFVPRPLENLDTASAQLMQGAETSAPRPLESSAAFIAPQPELAGQDLAAAELPFSDAWLHGEPLANQAEQTPIQSEQGNAQLEQSISPERADHLPKLNSAIKEISKENQKEIQEQEQKTIASQSEAYVPARLVKESLILDANTQNASSEKASDGVGQDSPAVSPEHEAARIKNGTETLGVTILNHYTALELQSQESGFARAASAKNQSAASQPASSNATPQAVSYSHKLPLAAPSPTSSSHAGQKPAATPKATAQSETGNAVQSPDSSPTAPTRTKAGHTAQKPAVKAKTAALPKAGKAAQTPAATPKAAEASEASGGGNTANPAQKAVANCKAAAQTQAGQDGQTPLASPKAAASTTAGHAGQTPAESHNAATESKAGRGGKAVNPAQKPKSKGKAATANAQTVAGGKSGDAPQEGRVAAKRAEAKRLRTPGTASPSAKPDAAPTLYAEVVRRVFSSSQELLHADSAFVWLWVGFFRGSLKDTVMKSHKSQQLSDAPMDPAGILAFSLWYRERYKQATLPRNPETLRARCEEFRALPSMDAWLEKGQRQLDALKTALAAGTEPKLETPSTGFSYATAKPPLDESGMQAFDWNEFFKE